MKIFSSFLRSWAKLPPRLQVLLVVSATAWLFATLRSEESWDIPDALPKPQRKVVVQTLAPEEFSERIRVFEQTGDAASIRRCRRLGLLSLGLVSTVEPRIDLTPPSLLERWRGSHIVPAYYIAGTDTIFSTSEGSFSVPHEMIHAVEDQYGTRLRDVSQAGSTDEQLALRSAVEGTAVVLSSGSSLALVFGKDLDFNAMVLAYAQAPDYVERKAGRDFNKLITVRPSSVAEILFNRPWESAVRWEEHTSDEREELCTDRVGPLGVLTSMLRSGASSDRALWLAQAWVDDRMEVSRDEAGDRWVVWTVYFRDEEAAKLWKAGPGVQTPLTSARTYIETHTMRADSVAVPSVRATSPLGELGS